MTLNGMDWVWGTKERWVFVGSLWYTVDKVAAAT